MLVLVSYDVSVAGKEGQKRLRKIAKICVNYGQRVQNSVFEIKTDPTTMLSIKKQLLHAMDAEIDSIRFYNLGDRYQSRIEHFGARPPYDPEELLLI